MAVYVVNKRSLVGQIPTRLRLLNAQGYRFYRSAKQYIAEPIARVQGGHILVCCRQQIVPSHLFSTSLALSSASTMTGIRTI